MGDSPHGGVEKVQKLSAKAAVFAPDADAME